MKRCAASASSLAISGNDFCVRLYRITEVRETTRNAPIFARSVMRASVTPSAKYSCSRSPLMFLNGSTATYFLGCDAQTGLIGPHTVAEFLGNAVELSTAITGDVFDRFYDFDAPITIQSPVG